MKEFISTIKDNDGTWEKASLFADGRIKSLDNVSPPI